MAQSYQPLYKNCGLLGDKDVGGLSNDMITVWSLPRGVCCLPGARPGCWQQTVGSFRGQL